MKAAIASITGDFDTSRAAELTGVSIRQINHWDSLGIVSPTIGPARGSGSRRRFAPDDLLLLAAANALRRAGASLESIRIAISAIHTAGIGLECPNGTIVVLAAEKAIHVGHADRWEGINASGEECLTVLNLQPLAARIRSSLEQASAPQVSHVRVGEITYPVTVEPLSSGGFVARLKSRRPSEATGPTPDAAVSALRQLAESKATAPAETPRQRRPRPPRKPDGASTWGGEW